MVMVIPICILLSLPTQRLVEIPITSRDEVNEIARTKITIVDASSTHVKALLNDAEIERLRGLGHEVRVIVDDYKAYCQEFSKLANYHTYQEVVDEMISVADSHPDVAFLDTIGYSVEGRLILGMRISDNAHVHENEPGIRFTGCHHGDEHIATEIVLYMIHYLVDNYASSPEIKELVDTRETWLIPMVSPDGVFHSSRMTANGVDPNRDYGYMWEGWGGSPSPFSQPEIQSMRKNVLDNRFVLGFDYHSGGPGTGLEVVNTVWDYTHIYTQDDTVVMDVGKEYADSTGYWLIRGAYWYEVHGSCQDAMYGCEGIIDYTIEAPEPEDPIPICEHNRGAMLSMIKRAGDVGIAGIVTDSVSGAPLDARVDIQEIHWPIYTDARLGDYHRIAVPGAYTVKIEANGYLPKAFPGVVVSDSVTVVNAALTPGGKSCAHRIVWVTVADPNDAQTNYTLTPDVLGPQDGRFLSLGVGGDIVVDMGHSTRIADSFTVYEGDDGTPDEGYQVSVSNSWNGPFDLLGTYYGTHGFSIGTYARYVRITDDGDGNPDTAYAGFDLDAIEACSVVGAEESNWQFSTGNGQLSIHPNPFIEKTVISYRLPVGARGIVPTYPQHIALAVHDLSGRSVRTLQINKSPNQQINEVSWDGKDNSGKDVAPGIYFCRLVSGDFTAQRKLVRIR